MKPFLIALLAPLTLAALAQSPVPASSPTPANLRAKAPDFTLKGVNGEDISLSKLKGKVILLDFWATTCGGCKTELPWYVAFADRYRAQGLSVIGLDMYGETPATIRPFMVKWKMNYPVAVGTDAIGESFGLKEMPLTVLIDRNGKIALSHAGVVDRDAFENALKTLLNEPPSVH